MRKLLVSLLFLTYETRLMSVFVVLPTYNEKANLSQVLFAILQYLPQAKVLVVDDNSPDGTGLLADRLASQNPERILVLHRAGKEGLGRAYLHGFAQALKLGASQVIQMDADFSHPPSLLPKLIKALENADFAIASRYVSGGGIKNWALSRRFLSRGGNYYARLLLGTGVKDLTGGFKGFHKRVLDYLLQCPIQNNGYAFQIEMTARAIHAGFIPSEIPFMFEDRQVGVSKMSKGIVSEALVKVWNLRKELATGPSVSPSYSILKN